MNFHRQSPAEILLWRFEWTLNREARAAESACPENTRWTALLLPLISLFSTHSWPARRQNVCHARQNELCVDPCFSPFRVWFIDVRWCDTCDLSSKKRWDRDSSNWTPVGMVNFLMQTVPLIGWFLHGNRAAGSSRLAGFQSQGFWKPWWIKNSCCQGAWVLQTRYIYTRIYWIILLLWK